jgi:hypothetical protein
MPAIQCRCEARISYGAIPCPDQWLLISDVAYDRFAGQVDAEAVYEAFSPVLKCPTCARLYVFWRGFREPPTEYVAAASEPESSRPDRE